jgi:hypothetical protein
MSKQAKIAGHTFTVPYSSREIHRDGKPFIVIQRANSGSAIPSPVDVDAFARLLFSLLEQHAATEGNAPFELSEE